MSQFLEKFTPKLRFSQHAAPPMLQRATLIITLTCAFFLTNSSVPCSIESIRTSLAIAIVITIISYGTICMYKKVTLNKISIYVSIKYLLVQKDLSVAPVMPLVNHRCKNWHQLEEGKASGCLPSEQEWQCQSGFILNVCSTLFCHFPIFIFLFLFTIVVFFVLCVCEIQINCPSCKIEIAQNNAF